MSVIVPAYNEKTRLGGMLEEAVAFLERSYAERSNRTSPYTSRLRPRTSTPKRRSDGTRVDQTGTNNTPTRTESTSKTAATATATATALTAKPTHGWEILVISDSSTDGTADAALSFARDHQASTTTTTNTTPKPIPGPHTPHPTHSTQIPPGLIRVISLEENRGKGGAVIHGMRHARGRYVLFADADGASKFDDLDMLVRACADVEDENGRGVAIGSRAHLVGGDAVVKVRTCFPG